MGDQADKLRNLVQAAPVVSAAVGGGAPIVVVTGCKAGVGATTVAVNVAAVLADRGMRVLVLDADEERSSMAEIAGLRTSSDYTLADAIAGKCSVADAVVAGPGGVKILTARGRVASKRATERRGVAGKASEFRRNSATWDKQLLASLRALRGDYDIIVVDTGAGLSRTARRLWLRAQLALLVTTGDDAAVMDAYAAVKLHVVGARDATCENLRVLVNQVESERAAADAVRRLTNCCQRFLRQSVAALPALPLFGDREDVLRHAPTVTAGVRLHPRVWELPDSQFGHAVLWLGRAVGDVMEGCKPTVCEVRGQRKRGESSRNSLESDSTRNA
jgi:flagellar biosynthesis protein FlhG